MLDKADNDELTLEAGDGLPRAVHVFDGRSVLAVNAAFATGRPLLLRGKPGPGKT